MMVSSVTTTERRNQARGATEWAETYGSIGSSSPTKQIQLPLTILDPWRYPDGRPQIFKAYSRKKLEALAESIRENGIIEPICVRPLPNGRFQIIAGHNRVEAAKLAGLNTVPALVRILSDREARKLLRDSNLQHRPVILPSERAWCYHEIMKEITHRGKRADLTSDNDCPKLSEGIRSDQIIAEMYGVSATSVKQYIRLLNLHPALLDMVDNEAQCKDDRDPTTPCLTFVAGYELSFLPETEQTRILTVINSVGKAPSTAQAKQLRKKYTERELDEAAILSVVHPTKASKSPKAATVKLPAERISSFFPPNTTPEQMESEICEALMAYRKNNNTPASA